MDEYKVFTLGKPFPLADMRKFISDLHGNDQHYIVMVDPGLCFTSRLCLHTLILS
jgi:alpha-glucosidase